VKAENRIGYDNKNENNQRGVNEIAAMNEKKNIEKGARSKNTAKNGAKHKNKSTNSKKSSEVLFEFENPFTLPNDNDIYHLAHAPSDEAEEEEEEERAEMRKRKMMERRKNLKAHEKTTYISRMNATNTQIVKDIKAMVEQEFAAENAEKPPKNWDLGVAKDRIVEKEGMEDYIRKKREMFFTSFLENAKEKEMGRLQQLAKSQQAQINLEEKQIEDKAKAFDVFLKEMDKTSIGVIREAEDQTNLKMDLQLEVKRLNAEIMAVLSEIQKHEDTLKEYQLYKRFLDSLAPREWKEARRASLHLKKKKKKSKREPEGERRNSGVSQEESRGGDPSINSTDDKSDNMVIDVDDGGIDSDSDDYEDAEEDDGDVEGQSGDESAEETGGEETGPEIYFTDPMQLLDILGDLEEQNLSLIQNSQETEETLDNIKTNIRVHKDKMKEETETLKRQIDILEIAIQKEQERARELERKYAVLIGGGGGGGGGGDDAEGFVSEEEREQRHLERRVREIYQLCIGDEESNISTLQMLTNVEVCMEDLLCFMERTPKEKLEAAEKVKEMERKELVKKEMIEATKRMAEERRKRERERANADVKPKKGKQLVFRSEPPPIKAKAQNQRMKEMIQQEEEHYFFKW